MRALIVSLGILAALAVPRIAYADGARYAAAADPSAATTTRPAATPDSGHHQYQ